MRLSMKTSPPKPAGERGAVMVIFAVTIVAMMGFMAIAVDTAHAFVERRDSQATADVAAIGGALTLINNNGSAKVKATALVDQVFAIASRNLTEPLDWQNCTDPGRPTDYTVSAADTFISSIDPQYTQCISWTPDWRQVRVKIPDRSIDTFFAGVIGFGSVEIGAFAEVTAIINGAGGVLPFGILSQGTNGLVCLKTGPQFPDDSCDRNESGNFDFLDFKPYGNTAMNTIADCNLAPVESLKQNIAHGVDHDLAVAPADPSDDQGIGNAPNIFKEDVQCSSKAQKIQAVLTETGNKQNVIIEGFIEGSGGFEGRLALGTATREFNYYGTMIDDVGLWEYLTDDAAANLCPGTDTEDEILACIAANPGVEIFKDTIQYSARIARVPELHQTVWPTGTKYVSFKNFAFVYIQTLYGGCGNNQACSLEIEPGLSGEKILSGADPVAITAIGIPHLTLPEDVRERFGTPRVETYALTR
jgi:hypothetical protein